jgi:cation transport regulator ChaC
MVIPDLGQGAGAHEAYVVGALGPVKALVDGGQRHEVVCRDLRAVGIVFRIAADHADENAEVEAHHLHLALARLDGEG